MTVIKRAFEPDLITVRLPLILPSRQVTHDMLTSVMEKLYHDYRLVEDTLGETMLVLVVAKGYVSRILRNQTIAAYLERFEPDLVRELVGVVEAVTADARSLERE